MGRKKQKKIANKASTDPISEAPFTQPQNAGYTFNPQRGAAPDKTLQVDSWRSYKNDTTNLQVLTSIQSPLNATAADFIPNNWAHRPDNTSHPSYQCLRDLNGLIERAAIDSNKSDSVNLRQYSTNFASRYPTRSGSGLCDEPLPSIEDGTQYTPPPTFPVLRKVTQADKQSILQKTKSTAAITTDPHRARTPRRTVSPTPPKITDEYLADASRPPSRLLEPQKLLVILDLNGTLLFRKKASTYQNPLMRPGVSRLMEYLFENHAVMIYTSAMPESAFRMITHFLPPRQRNNLVAMWARDKLDLSKDQFRSKVQVYKKLDKVWRDEDIQKTAGPGRKWDQSNTILVDDSKLKALAQPYNLLQIPEYTRQDIPEKGKTKQLTKIQIDIMKGVELKLEELRYQDNVSRLIRMWRINELDVPKLPNEKVVIEDATEHETPHDPSLELVHDKDGSAITRHRTDYLPTPQSMDDDDEMAGASPYVSDDEEEDGGMPTDNGLNRSVSPIDAAVFRELLEGTCK